MSRDPKYQKLLNQKRWKQLRMTYLQEHPLCERCYREGIEQKGKPYIRSAIDVHHKVPVESAHTIQEMEQLAYDWNNLQALCIPCHVKTHKEIGKNKKENVKERKQIALQRWIDRQTKKSGDPSAISTDNTKLAASDVCEV